jgi:hypothetical protein
MNGDQLPAILAAAEISLAASTGAATTRSALALLRRTSFIYDQRPPHQRTPIAGLHRLNGGRIIVYFDKPKSPRLTTKTIT